MSNAKGSDRVGQLIEAISTRTIEYLNDELGIVVTPIAPSTEQKIRMELRNLTAIVGVEAEIRLLIAFSFDKTLAQEVFNVSTEGMDIAAEEREMMCEESIAEMINVVVGNATGCLTNLGTSIPITPPIVISEAKSITRQRGASFHSLELDSTHGMMSIHFVGPKDLFDLSLDYMEKTQ